jgi:hypothetical protein
VPSRGVRRRVGGGAAILKSGAPSAGCSGTPRSHSRALDCDDFVFELKYDGFSALRASDQAYDKRVAGVAAGAGDYKPGIVLDKKRSQNNRLAIALIGKVQFVEGDGRSATARLGSKPGYPRAFQRADRQAPRRRPLHHPPPRREPALTTGIPGDSPRRIERGAPMSIKQAFQPDIISLALTKITPLKAMTAAYRKISKDPDVSAHRRIHGNRRTHRTTHRLPQHR